MNQPTGSQLPGERHETIQRGRARQYTLCTIALQHDRLNAGTEGVFDQALTNGLAAIVAHAWSGKETDRRGRVLSAADLLKVIETHGTAAEDGEEGVMWVLHDPDGPRYHEPFHRYDDYRLPNFTTVKLTTLRAAIDATQAIRHARDAGTEDEEHQVITEEHLDALSELDFHPALHTVSDALRDRYELNVQAADAAEWRRAESYLEFLHPDELERRAAVDYQELHEYHYKDEDVEVEGCPVCGNLSLVAEAKESTLCEIGVGRCMVCSYERSYQVAVDMAETLMLQRAVDRAD